MTKAKNLVVSLAALLAGDTAAVAVVTAALAAEACDDFAAWNRGLSVPGEDPNIQTLRRLGAHQGFDVKE